MSHPQDVQPELPDPPSDPDGQILDASSLNTVLDMLTVIDSAEDLALLEHLTLVQKRQVWDATPEEIKLRLKQIRAAAADAISETTALAPPESLLTSELQTQLEADLTPHQPLTPTDPVIQQGDRVVLLAQPQLTATEMKAIWEVMSVEADQAHVQAPGLSDRQYPLAWMIRYPHCSGLKR